MTTNTEIDELIEVKSADGTVFRSMDGLRYTSSAVASEATQMYVRFEQAKKNARQGEFTLIVNAVRMQPCAVFIGRGSLAEFSFEKYREAARKAITRFAARIVANTEKLFDVHAGMQLTEIITLERSAPETQEGA